MYWKRTEILKTNILVTTTCDTVTSLQCCIILQLGNRFIVVVTNLGMWSSFPETPVSFWSVTAYINSWKVVSIPICNSGNITSLNAILLSLSKRLAYTEKAATFFNFQNLDQSNQVNYICSDVYKDFRTQYSFSFV